MSGLFTMCKHDDGDGLVRIVLTGEIDADVSPALSTMMVNAADQNGVAGLVVDLERVSLLSAAGIRSLLEARAAAGDRGLPFGVVNPGGLVEEALMAAGVSGPLMMRRSPSAATARHLPASGLTAAGLTGGSAASSADGSAASSADGSAARPTDGSAASSADGSAARPTDGAASSSPAARSTGGSAAGSAGLTASGWAQSSRVRGGLPAPGA
ncbi:hypothetical protein Ade02nite_09680 [Paractinoplanes deccanensis]|uniref:STAS domain-containing protein n=1 Tax=Paractinoplanes deccanensis TaxID=113561 RepID=A0ABQ3XX53_9ACTN|nr:STAS domain-containing protein [Actinoplanes deccanensis]GID72327.1 hypothetical protein Ade02nite_09680 [Actinoplanes deccanensis]